MTIETARLRLREPASDDVEVLRDYYRRNEERFALWGENRRDLAEEHSDWIHARHADRRNGAPTGLIAVDRETGATVAVVTLSGFSTTPPGALLSYSVDGAYEGRGFASEAVGAVVAYAFATLGLQMLSAYYEPENLRSERLLQRLGFHELARIAALPLPHVRQRGQVVAILERPAPPDGA